MSAVPTIHKRTREIEMVDLADIYALSDGDYRCWVMDGLLYIDTHGALRVNSGDAGLATTREQLDILVDELRRVRPELPARVR